MRNLILVALLMPVLSFGQKLEVSEIGGYSRNISHQYFFQNSAGFANQVAINYHPCKYFSIGAYHQLDAWKPYTNSAGFVADVHYKHIYFGVNVGELFFSKKTERIFTGILDNASLVYDPKANTVTYSYKINQTIAAGAHLGMEYQLYKRFVYKQEVEYSAGTSKGEVFTDNYKIKIHNLSALAGIAYRF